MSDDLKPGASGPDPKPASGGTDTIEQPNNSDAVKYETYRRVVSSEKNLKEANKSLQDKVDAFETAKKESEENTLKKNQEWQKFAEAKEKEAKDAIAAKTTLERRLNEGVKLDAFLKAVNGDVESQYFGLIDLDGIAVDPTTGLPETSSVQESARKFESQFGRVIQRGDGPRLPNEAPKGSGTPLTHDQWKNLPLKEMKQRIPDIITALKKQ